MPTSNLDASADAPGELARISLTPAVSMSAQSTRQMIAIGYDANDRGVLITPTWSVVAHGGTIDALGAFSAGAAVGAFINTVVATVGFFSGHTSVTVTPAKP